MEVKHREITGPEWAQLELSVKNLVYSQNMIFGWYNDEELKRTPERILQFYREWMDSNNFHFTT